MQNPMTQPDAQTKPDDLSEDPEETLVLSESWAGEVRINLIRLAALVFFYAQHLSSVYVFKDDGLTPAGRSTVTILVLLWVLAAVGLHFILSRRWLPPLLPYLSIGVDLVMIDNRCSNCMESGKNRLAGPLRQLSSPIKRAWQALIGPPALPLEPVLAPWVAAPRLFLKIRKSLGYRLPGSKQRLQGSQDGGVVGTVKAVE